MRTQSVSSSGQTATQAYLVTDPVQVAIPVGGSIKITGYIFQGYGQLMANNHLVGISGYNLGEGYALGSSLTDESLATAPVVNQTPTTTADYIYNPVVAVIGMPLTSGPTACIIASDSRVAGVTGSTRLTGLAVASGSGFVAGDVGKTFSVPGGSANGTGSPAMGIITSVTSGVPTIALYSPGSYSTSQPGQSVPTSPQAVTVPGSSGTLSVSFASVSSPFDDGDPAGNQGYLARWLALNGVPYVKMAKSGAVLQSWAAVRSYSQAALVQAVGCSSAIGEDGINDVSSGNSAAQIEAWITQVAAQMQAIGVPLFWNTLLPATTSTDGYSTPSNQAFAPGTPNSVRVQINSDLRAGAVSGLAGVIDAAAPVEVNSSNVLTPNGGYWITSGSPGFLVVDGVHPTSPGISNADKGHAYIANRLPAALGILK